MLQRIARTIGLLIIIALMLAPLYIILILEPAQDLKQQKVWEAEHACQKIDKIVNSVSIGDESIPFEWDVVIYSGTIYHIPSIVGHSYTDQHHNVWTLSQYNPRLPALLCKNVDQSTP